MRAGAPRGGASEMEAVAATRSRPAYLCAGTHGVLTGVLEGTYRVLTGTQSPRPCARVPLALASSGRTVWRAFEAAARCRACVVSTRWGCGGLGGL
jgi:hypothetical protein